MNQMLDLQDGGTVVHIAHELTLTVARNGEGWTVLVEGSTECDKDAIHVTVQTVNDDETVTWVL